MGLTCIVEKLGFQIHSQEDLHKIESNSERTSIGWNQIMEEGLQKLEPNHRHLICTQHGKLRLSMD